MVQVEGLQVVKKSVTPEKGTSDMGSFSTDGGAY